MVRTLRLTLLLTGIASLALAQQAGTAAFRGTMLPTNEIPATNIEARAMADIRAHVMRDASGQIVSGSVDFIVRYNFPPAQNFTGLHIHRGDSATNGPVMIDTGITAANSVIDATGVGVITRQVQIRPTDTAALSALRDMMANPAGFYVNIHTTQFPGGAVRAQLDPALSVTYVTRMSPANEIPAITGTNASATAAITVFRAFNSEGKVSSGMVMFEVDYDLTQQYTVTGLHIHRGFANENAAVVVDTGISGANNVMTADNGRGQAIYMVEVPANAAGEELLGALSYVPEAFYVNMHTTVNPGGFIRGQLRAAETRRFAANMLPSNEVPPVDIAAAGLAFVEVSSVRNAAGAVEAAAVTFDVNFRFPEGIEITGLHIHDGEAGINGPVRIDSGVTGNAAVPSETGFGNITRRMRVADAAGLATLNSMLANPALHYLNLHTRVNPGGVIRSQLAPAN